VADLMYNGAKHKMWSHATLNIDLIADTTTIKVMLISNAVAYVPNADHDFVDEADTTDPIDAETNVTNYTRGFGNSGRKAMVTPVVTTNDTADRAEYDALDHTWTALGNGTNETVVGAILIKEITNDAASPLIAFFDFTDFTTNGSDFTLQWAATGVMHLTFGFWPLGMLKRMWSDFSQAMSPKVQKWFRAMGFRPHIVRQVNPIQVRGEVRR